MSLCDKLRKLRLCCKGKDEELEELREENQKLKEDNAILKQDNERLNNKVSELTALLEDAGANLIDFHESDEFVTQWMREEDLL